MKKLEGWVTAPQGFIAAGVKAGIKASGNHDVAVIFSTVPAACGAVFTQNKMCAAPVLVSREVNKHGYAQAIAVNSGCANACTGEQGLADAKKMQAHTAELLGIAPEAVFVCSTGVIGQFLPMDKLLTGIADAVDSLDECEGESCAMAIQTTDTFIKHAAYETEIGGKKVTFAGIAKGAGMIHPNMATMLTFITTDAAVAPDVLKRAVKKAADKSFNMVVVDGDTSTNDSMIVLANGLAENAIILSEEHPDYPAFFEALVACATDLAKMIAHDGEGATKFLEVNVTGAATWEDAKTAAMAIAKSPLVKTAFFGEDPNWGRLTDAAGYARTGLEYYKIDLDYDGVAVLVKGQPVAENKPLWKKIVSQKTFTINMNLNLGDAEESILAADLTEGYVNFNKGE